MAELRSAIFWVLNCPIYLLRCYILSKNFKYSLDLLNQVCCSALRLEAIPIFSRNCRSLCKDFINWAKVTISSGSSMTNPRDRHDAELALFISTKFNLVRNVYPSLLSLIIQQYIYSAGSTQSSDV